MTDVGPYGVHQHSSPDAVHLHALVGEPARQATLDQAIEGVSRATFSTAPFKGGPKVTPKRKYTAVERDRIGRCTGLNNHCKNRPIRDTDRCWFHTPKTVHCIGNDGQCKASPMRGTELCQAHTKQKARRDARSDP